MAQMGPVSPLIVCVAVIIVADGLDREPNYEAYKKLLMSQRVLVSGS